MNALETTYNHKKFEQKWWDYWIDHDFFHAEVDTSRSPYTILIPPPNVTDKLHMGHGLNNTIQDILIRWKRMQGFNCMWLPGTDHAGIATQMMVEKSLEDQGTSRKELGRQQFYERCEAWKNKHGDEIVNQLKRLGASCDWKRQSYTMDPALSQAVRWIFVDLYNKGFIYRGQRLVNWDPNLQTAISDDEVENREIQGNLWHIKYQVVGDSNETLIVATTRPETMLGDTAIAVNPEDQRYQNLVGKKVRVPFVDRAVPIIADSYVKEDFGTGCLKVTPAHDLNDFELGKRHNLEMINIFNPDGTLSQDCPSPFAGLDRFEARKRIVTELKKAQLLEKTVSIVHTVPFSERSKAIVEPRLSHQWYVRMKALAQPAIDAAKKETLKFYPKVWKKTYLHWLENVQDWCISRQLWWGHRIPIWFCSDCGSHSTGIEDPSHCHSCNSPNISQDEDVLDTWFSSWLWPLSPFGWPNSSKELDYFFPSAVLVTGPDIIYLWVARMVMASFYAKDQLPFENVYFNAIICDHQGRKFSKTLGNGIDPLKVIDKFGADAVRYTCVSLAPRGGRVKMGEEDFENGNRFVNKIWNAARFLLNSLNEGESLQPLNLSQLSLAEKWLIHEVHLVSAMVDQQLSCFQINEAVSSLFQLAWRSFCDWGVETAKLDLESDQPSRREQSLSTLFFSFEGIVRLIAPVMPFICEEIWHKLPKHPNWARSKSLVNSAYPLAKEIPKFAKPAGQWSQVQEVISGIRSLRTQGRIPPKNRVCVVVNANESLRGTLDQSMPWVERLAKTATIEIFGLDHGGPGGSLTKTGRDWAVFLPVGDHLDIDKELHRLDGEIKRVRKIVASLEKKLASESFIKRAPREIVVQNEKQLDNMLNQLKSLQTNLNSLKKS